MTETQALEVEKIEALKKSDSGEESIEASVGDDDVAALVEETAKQAEAVEVMETDAAVEEEMKKDEVTTASSEETTTVAEPMETSDESNKEQEVAITESERISTNDDDEKAVEKEQRISEEATITNTNDEEETQSHIPAGDEPGDTDDTSNNTAPCDDNNDNETDPSSIKQSNNTETIPSTNIETVKTEEESQTQTVLHSKEETITDEEAAEAMNEDLEEEAAAPMTDESFTEISETLMKHSQESASSTVVNNVLKSVVDTTINDISSVVSTLGQSAKLSPAPPVHTHVRGPLPNGSQGLPMKVKPPKIDLLLQTARENLNLTEEPAHVIMGPSGQLVTPDLNGMTGLLPVSEANNLLTQNTGQRLSMDSAEGAVEFSDENATYILEPITNEVVYNDDPNIMWIQETVEVEQETGDGQNMIIILNPNGTVNEELMLANGINQDIIKAVASGGVLNLQQQDAAASIRNLQQPIPQKDLGDVKPLMTGAGVPRTVMETLGQDGNRSIILDQKQENYLVLDDLDKETLMNNIELPNPVVSLNGAQGAKIININGTQHIITNQPRAIAPKITSQFIQKQTQSDSFIMPPSLPITPLGTLDLSLPKKPDPSVMEQFVNPGALVSETSVLKALSKPESGNIVTKDHLTGKLIKTQGQKMRRVRGKAGDENGNAAPYVQRKTTSLGALGQALHGPFMGIPRDSRENAVQICPICKFQATTKNPYRHLQDHLARNHFKERIAAELPTKKPYICPESGCENKAYPDWQAVMRHYIGKKHGVLDRFVKEELAQIRKENGGKIPGTVITPAIEVQL